MEDGISPLKFSIALDAYTGTPSRVDFTYDACKAARDSLIYNRILDSDGNITERGRVWIKYALATPFSVQSWKLPQRTLDGNDEII